MLAAHLADDPADADALALLARMCANSGSLAAACRWVGRARAVSNLEPGTHYIEAVIQLERGAAEEARAALERALFLSPGFVLAHVAMARLARDEGRAAKATKHLEAAQAILDAADPEGLADALDGIDNRRLKGAVDALRQLIAGGGR
jgi:chemotaxis protein methyltransferase CheR